MKVIVTGGEGFIGKALAAMLRKRGVEVVSVDRRNGTEAGEYFASADLTNIDCVYHLAAQTSVFNANKSDIIHDNIETFKAVCDACARHGTKLVYASSSTAADGNTTSLYGISKRFNEEYARCYNPTATGVRFHNVYGPDPRQGTLLWCLLTQERVKLYNMGRNIRHFTYIDDILESLIFAYGSSVGYTKFRIVKSKFLFSWIGRGESVDIPVVTPQNVARTLLRRIAGGKVNVDVSISGHDPRLAYTRLFAAESARNITGAKFYSSFNEFCDWMAAVFGYVYYLGEPVEPEFRRHRICGRYVYSVSSYQTGTAGSPGSANDIVYVVNQGRFLYRNPQTGGMYLHWLGSEDYNGSNERARTDTLFTISQLSPTNLYYFGQYNGGPLTPTLYEGTADSVGVDKQTVYFVHRSELLNPDAPVRKIPHCREVKYSVDSGAIYSSVTIGYDKKDYDSINGRDEFNFNNTYSTGSTVTDKTLQLLSKYRADCYGIEFAVQKRGKETTDSTSDKDVFFVLCKNQNGALVPDRTTAVTGTLSDQVFNADFSPLACVRANAGYIGIQSKVVNLAFASSAGNSDITIAGVAMSADITLNTPLATCGSIDFTTDAVDDIANPDEIIEITDGGMTYRGFLKEVDVKYARTEAAKYKLIIKEIEI